MALNTAEVQVGGAAIAAARTYTVPGESRVLTVPFENRVLTVVRETRVITA